MSNRYDVTVTQDNAILVEVGAPGLTGPQGDQGIQGDTGIQGIQGDAGVDGQGVPIGGAADQVLTKIDATDYNTEWVNPVTGVTDHTLLTNIGTNTHTVIDAHIGDNTIHFTQAAISITESQISDLGTYETAFTKNTGFNKDFGTITGTVCQGDDARLSDARTPTAHTHLEADITDLQSYLLDITGESIKDLSDVFTTMVPLDGHVLTYDTTNGWQSEAPVSGVTDHTLLSNIGTNSHADIDSHIVDGTIHFTQAAISITESQISDLGSYSLTSHTHAVNDLTDVFNSTPADRHVLIYDGVTDIRYENRLLVEADISDLGTYLTAEVNDLSSAVTWVNVPDANITQTSVTQHQAALSITESQISDFGTYLTNITGESVSSLSDVNVTTPAVRHALMWDGVDSWDNRLLVEADISDLGTYLTAEVNDLSSAVTWANVPDANITQSSVTQHVAAIDHDSLLNFTADEHFLQSAISITESQISDLGTYANRDATLNTQTGTAYTAVIGDSDDMITMNNAASNTVTIPANASVAYPVGTKLNFMQLGAGATTVAITTDTLNVNASFTLVLDGQYAVATALKMTSTSWVLFGTLVAA